MSTRRTVLLAAVVALGVAGVLLVPAPVPLRPRDQVHGPRLLKAPADAVRAVEATLDDTRVRLERAGGRWTLDGRPAGAPLAAAADHLVATLAELRAVDRFRDARDAPFGLDRPRGTLVVETPRDRVRFTFGAFNAARSAVYARQDARPRVLLVGVYLLAAIDRVFFYARLERGAGGPQRPEIG